MQKPLKSAKRCADLLELPPFLTLSFLFYPMAHPLLFGTAGIPLSAPKRDSVLGVAHVKKLGLSAMELEFVRGVNMSASLARQVNGAARAAGVALSVHAPYYINLNAKEPQKRGASRKRIL